MFVYEIYQDLAEAIGSLEERYVFKYLNNGVQILLNEGHWTNATKEKDLCTGWDEITLTLPREIETPIAINVKGRPTYARNRLFGYHVNGRGNSGQVPWSWDDRGFVSTMMDIRDPSQLIALCENDIDYGLKLRIIGSDKFGRSLITQTDDGQLVNGIYITVKKKSDFYGMMMTADNVTIPSRIASIVPIDLLESDPTLTVGVINTNQYSAGEKVIITEIQTTTGTPYNISLQVGQFYYIGIPITSDTTKYISLHTSEIDALNNNNPLRMVNVSGINRITTEDQRISNTNSVINFSTTVPVVTGNEVRFIGDNLPTPLISGNIYFISSLLNNNYQVFNRIIDAQNNENPVYMTGTGFPNQALRLRNPIAPVTNLSFTIPHYYNTGDAVYAYNNGGQLPKPLVENVYYFVRKITDLSVSLHLNAQDAIDGTNQVILLDNGTGVSSLAKLIPASANLGNINNINANGFNLNNPSGSGAVIRAIPTGVVTGISITNSGTGYTTAPIITFNSTGGNYYSNTPTVYVESFNGNGAQLTAVVDFGQQIITGVTIQAGGIAYQAGDKVFFSAETGWGAKGTVSTVDVNGGITSIVLVPVGSGFAAHAIVVNGVVQTVVIDNPGTGFAVSPKIFFSYGNASATSIITTSFITDYNIYSVGSLYTNPPALSITGIGTGATATAIVSNGSVKKVTPVTLGTGYLREPSVTITASTGVFVQFSSSGELPNPLSQGTGYRAETPSSNGTFTVKNVDFSDVNITSSGSGQFFVDLTRSFALSFNNQWTGDFAGIQTGYTVNIAADYLLPITTPQIDSNTLYTVTKISNLLLTLTSGTTPIVINQIGSGQLYFELQITCGLVVYNNQIIPTNTDYLFNGIVVIFTTTGTLPTPLVANTQYYIKLLSNGFQLYSDSALTQLITITSTGIGQLTMSIKRYFNFVDSSAWNVSNNVIETGDQILIQSSIINNDQSNLYNNTTFQQLPIPLQNGIFYYARTLPSLGLIGANYMQLYDTKAHAQDVKSSVGLIVYSSVGYDINSTFFIYNIQDPVFVKEITNVEKPLSNAYISLYAWDYGRGNDLTLIGQYHPKEVNPRYRRIRLGTCCAWVRVLYKVKFQLVTSQYDYVPIENRQALIEIVKSLFLFDKEFFDAAEKKRLLAINYLKKEQQSLDSHTFYPPQINCIDGDRNDVNLY